jgi:hypothetical protein
VYGYVEERGHSFNQSITRSRYQFLSSQGQKKQFTGSQSHYPLASYFTFSPQTKHTHPTKREGPAFRNQGRRPSSAPVFSLHRPTTVTIYTSRPPIPLSIHPQTPNPAAILLRHCPGHSAAGDAAPCPPAWAGTQRGWPAPWRRRTGRPGARASWAPSAAAGSWGRDTASAARSF